MSDASLDDVDRGILYALQRDARNVTIAEIAEEVDVSASTVRNRIGQLEESGVIQGYFPKIDYERANYPLHVMFVCTAPAERREQLARDAIGSHGVVDVREMLTSQRNVYVEVVATDTRDLTWITNGLSELGVEIVSSEIITNHHVRPWAEFEFGPEADDG
jgi:DNA-binding Lrp family transcriptional regulator